MSGTNIDALLRSLTETQGRLFAEPPFNARGRLGLNPCDDRCVAGELMIAVDPAISEPRLSGTAAVVEPNAHAAAHPIYAAAP
jgi:hypothetical protein